MSQKIRKYIIAFALALIAFSTVGQNVHAQTSESYRFNNAAYVPGDSGTLTYYITNTARTTISLKNLTFYFPWAGYDPNNKWQGNVSINFSPWKTLVTSSQGGNVTYYNTISFQVPTWFGVPASAQNHNCDGGATRYGLFVGCVLIGTDQDTAYDTDRSLSVAIAQPTYTPTSINDLSTWVPLASLIVLIIATVILVMVMLRLGNLSKRS